METFLDEIERDGQEGVEPDRRISLELEQMRKDGSLQPIEVTASLLRNSKDEIVEILGITRGIAKRKQAERRAGLLAEMADIAPNSIIVHDFDGRMIYANQRTFEMHGYERDDFMATNLHDIDVPESEKLIAQRMKQVDETGEASFEVSHFRKDGSAFPIDMTWSLQIRLCRI